MSKSKTPTPAKPIAEDADIALAKQENELLRKKQERLNANAAKFQEEYDKLTKKYGVEYSAFPTFTEDGRTSVVFRIIPLKHVPKTQG